MLLKIVFLLVKTWYFIPQSGPCLDTWAFRWWLNRCRERFHPFWQTVIVYSIWQLQNDKKLNQDLSLKLKLSPGLDLRQWPALDKNVRHRYDVGLRTLWRENKFLFHPVLEILTSFRTDIAYFFILTSHLTVFRHIRLSDLDGSSLSTRLIIIKGVFLDIAFSFCPAF